MNVDIVYFALKVLPKNLISLVTGWICRCPLPSAIRPALFRYFARITGADISECSAPLVEYRSLSAFFVRELRTGARPIGEGIVSPADGLLRECAPIDNGTLVQGKGHRYSLDALLPVPSIADHFRRGASATIYLAPKNYHRVHSPTDGRVSSLIYVPGTLWPVNSWSLGRVPGLFSVNERLVFILETIGGTIAVVMVGATNVGSMTTPLHPIRTNSVHRVFRAKCPPASQFHLADAPQVGRGELLGTFHLGSTVIVLFSEGFTPVRFARESGPIKMGESLLIGGAAIHRSPQQSLSGENR